MHIASTDPDLCPGAKTPVHISAQLLERAIEHFRRNGWASKSTLRKALGVSPRTATNVIAYLRDELQVLEKSGNGYIWTGNIGRNRIRQIGVKLGRNEIGQIGQIGQ